ncbi:hypothetical protein R3P38DRAFT_2662269 [Favolaschia claudopus]|uniref:C2H2-type domain-containing protein n=1 Tax=Favolaschia claudopus TaxID=2862362 RepID=A0AAV9ZIT4_9AGAR
MSLQELYKKLKRDTGPYEELEQAARLFALDTVALSRPTSPTGALLSSKDDSDPSSACDRSSLGSVDDLQCEVGIPIAHYVPSTAFPPQKSRSPDETSSLLARYKDEGREPESESSVEDFSDDEDYIPSPSCNPVRNVTRLLTRSRNTQTAKSIQPIQNSCKRKKFTCDVCGYVQRNRRMPDFRRHLNTHTRTFEDNAQRGWQCKGVLRSEGCKWGIAADVPSYVFMDEERVGGCLKTFSRKDALKRHLDNSSLCVGWPIKANQ